MMIDLLAVSGDLASDLISRTSNTQSVQKIVQISLAPVFLLAAIGAFLNVMNGRLIWLTDRVDRLDENKKAGGADPGLEELPVLRRRQTFAYRAVNLSTVAALLICVVVALLFVSAFVRPQLGTYVAVAWILAMGLVFTALLFFLSETRLATSSASERRRLSRKMQDRSKSDDN
ncbi:DUF2721 domain-containing protein [Altererythrobacter aquiaggeris]|uniref:DUF2721 domain-containing protein n=1 Tax=Aestuarierythrobacter aquiaggeris TaxID=1898396 RepID=UPI00301A832C